MSRSHDKDYFFKFMSSHTAKIVLESSSLRWSKPSKFNDPFDHQSFFTFPFSKEEFSELLYSEVERLIYNDESTSVAGGVLSKLIIDLRASKNNMQKDWVLNALVQGIRSSGELLDNYQDNINSLISDDLNNSRVLCVTEGKNNIVMWAHYADSHKGVCIKLHCIDEIDNILLAAKPISYQKEFPVFPAIIEYVQHLTGEKPIDFAPIIYSIPYVKHEDWAYEKEWRVHVPHEPTHSLEGYDDWFENPNVFGAIYFGSRIETDEASDLIQIIEDKYPRMEIYQAKVSTSSFDLNYTKLR